MDMVQELSEAQDTMELIRTTDKLYNELIDPYFERNQGDLEKVLSVTLEELAEFSWEDFLEEEALESTLETYLDKVTENMTNLDTRETETKEEQEKNTEETTKRILVVDEKRWKRCIPMWRETTERLILQRVRKRKSMLLCVGVYTATAAFILQKEF